MDSILSREVSAGEDCVEVRHEVSSKRVKIWRSTIENFNFQRPFHQKFIHVLCFWTLLLFMRPHSNGKCLFKFQKKEPPSSSLERFGGSDPSFNSPSLAARAG
jgi:hypothetical protein